jgi:hypothetical protein
MGTVDCLFGVLLPKVGDNDGEECEYEEATVAGKFFRGHAFPCSNADEINSTIDVGGPLWL